ncbi:MAG: response regulator [Bacteroidia bacterium]
MNEILNLRKLEMGKMGLMETATDLYLFFQSHLAQFESKAQMQNIHFQFEGEIERDMVAAIDQEKCRQILYNLLGNAFKFTSEGGTIKGKVKILEQKLYLKVEDSGRGIHPEDLPHIFERFFQSRQPDKPAEGGTGIGLAICHEYLQLFGGEIHAESELDKGTAFRLSFPIKLLDKADLPEVHSEEVYDYFSIVKPVFSADLGEKSNSSNPHILIVEDNPNLQQYLQLILSDRFQVTTASHGKAALELLDKPNDFQLIISDLMMPIMDGYQLLEKLKSRDDTRQIPVIMLTARAEMSDKLKALRIGVDDYLKKPFNEEELAARIENLLKNQQVRQTEVESLPEKGQKVPDISQEDQEWLESFEEYVKAHFADDLLSVPDLALTFAMSESTLLRQLKRLTGLTPVQYLKEVRLNEAYQLLETRAFNSVSQVASKVGYTDARSFSRSFRKRFGVSPSEVLKK